MSTPSLRRRLGRGSQGESPASPEPQEPVYPAEQPPAFYGGGLPPNPERAVTEASPDGLKYIFEIAKSEVDAQFRIADRLDSKARGLFALAGAIFAAAQALALRSDVLTNLSPGDHDTVVTIAIVSGSILGVGLLATAAAIFVRKEKSVVPSRLVDWLNALATGKKTDERVSQEAVLLYIDLAADRQRVNKRRIYVMWVVQILCVLSIAASGIELIVALNGLA